MTIANHEYYVSLEVAKLLKEAGFEWEIKTFYFMDQLGETMLGDAKNHNFSNQFISAPTLEVAQRWLREVKNTHIEVSPDSTMSTYIYNILLSWDKFWLGSPISYSTYEEAQEGGIKKALEIILEKGE